MALVLADRVQEITTTSGTGTITLNGAVPGFQDFATGVGSGNETYYTLYDPTTYAWEVGIGTFTSSGTDTLSRDTVLSNSLGTTAKINLAGNQTNVFVTYPSEKSVNLNTDGVMEVGEPISYADTGIISTFASTVAGYNQVVVQNKSTATNASANLNVSNDASTSSNGFAELGINSSTFSNGPGCFNIPGAAYVASAGTDLAIGTYNAYNIHFATNSSTTDAMTIFDNGGTSLGGYGNPGIGNLAVNKIVSGITETTASGGTTALVAASTYYQRVVGTTTHTIQLPDATTLLNGTTFIVDNDSTGNVTVTNFATASLDVLPSGGLSYLYLTDNSTVAGTWTTHGYLPSIYNFNNTVADFANATIINAVWNGTTIGTGYGGTGLTTFGGADNALYSTGASTLTAGTLPPAAGGTGLTSLTANYVPYGNGTSPYQSSSTFTYDGTTLSAANFTTPGNLTFTGTGNRITGDFSNATFADRASFQSSTTNGSTRICVLPNGTATSTSFNFFNNSDPTNSGRAVVGIESTKCYVQASISGTGTYLPLTLETSGSEAMRIDTSGNVGIGTNSPVQLLTVESTSNVRATIRNSTENTSYASSLDFATGSGSLASTNVVGRVVGLITQADPSALQSALTFNTNSGDNLTEKMRIDSSGNVLVGTTTNGNSNRAIIEGTSTSGTGLQSVLELRGGGAGENGGQIGLINTFSGATNPNKWLRVSNSGSLQVVNSAYNNVVFGISDAGAVETVSTLTLNTGAVTGGDALVVNQGGDFRIYSASNTNSAVLYCDAPGLFYNNQRLVNSSFYYRLNSTVAGANSTATQNIFGVGVTVEASTIYEIEMVVHLLKTAGGTSHAIRLGFGGTATVNNIMYDAVQQLAAAATVVGSVSSVVTTTAITTVSVAIAATTLNYAAVVKGTVSFNAAGTFIPQYALTAAPGGAYTTQIGSYVKLTKLGVAGANINVGGWA